MFWYLLSSYSGRTSGLHTPGECSGYSKRPSLEAPDVLDVFFLFVCFILDT